MVVLQAVSAGNEFTCGILMESAQSLCWGENANGQSTVPAGHLRFEVNSVPDIFECSEFCTPMSCTHVARSYLQEANTLVASCNLMQL